MQRFGTVVILVALLAGLLVGCDRSARIPPGAQQVHVVATDTEVRLDPPTVHAGDVYLVLDVPDGGVAFVQTQRAADATPGAVSDADLARLKLDDQEGFRSEMISVPSS